MNLTEHGVFVTRDGATFEDLASPRPRARVSLADVMERLAGRVGDDVVLVVGGEGKVKAQVRTREAVAAEVADAFARYGNASIFLRQHEATP